MFVPNFKILGQAVPEKSLTKQSLQTDILKEKVKTTPNKISNWSFFKLIFPDQALIILKRILPIFVCFNRQMFSVVLINLSFNPQLFW